MKYKIFAVSDIHGHGSELIRALDEAGFDPQDPEHLFVCCGDCFDRGRENRKVMSYISGLPRKVLVRGNHEDLLENALDRYYVDFIDCHNGTDVTIREFFGKNAIDENGFIYKDLFIEPKLLAFTGSMVDYFETENYIFTHGWLPVFNEDDIAERRWENSSERMWKSARFTEWYKAYRDGLTVPGKIIVCGHRSARYGRMFDETRKDDDYGIFYGDGVIVLDATTVQSGRINVLVVEDELIE